MDDAKQPLYSRFEDDPALMDDIGEFVVQLAENVDALQDAESESDYGLLDQLVTRLGDDANRLGFPDLGAVTLRVHDACLEQKPEAIQDGLLELTEIAQRIRQGHRGAA